MWPKIRTMTGAERPESEDKGLLTRRQGGRQSVKRAAVKVGGARSSTARGRTVKTQCDVLSVAAMATCLSIAVTAAELSYTGGASAAMASAAALAIDAVHQSMQLQDKERDKAAQKRWEVQGRQGKLDREAIEDWKTDKLAQHKGQGAHRRHRAVHQHGGGTQQGKNKGC